MDINKIKPCGDKLLIKLDPTEDKTPGGIIKPQTRFLDLVGAEVISVSDGFWGQNGEWIDMPQEYKPGDHIYLQHGQAVPIEGFPDYAFIQMAAIIAKEKGEAKKVGGGKQEEHTTPGC